MEKSKGSIFVYWLTKGKKTEREKKNTKCILFYDNIFYLWPFSVVVILSYRKFYFLPSSSSFTPQLSCVSETKKTEWINENENKQQRQLRERWVVIFLVKCSGEMGCEKRKHKRHNKMRERERKKCFKHIRLVFIAWIC